MAVRRRVLRNTRLLGYHRDGVLAAKRPRRGCTGTNHLGTVGMRGNKSATASLTSRWFCRVSDLFTVWLISRYAEIRRHFHDLAVVHRGARLEERRHSVQFPNDRGESHPSVPTTDQEQLSVVHGRSNLGVPIDVQLHSEHWHDKGVGGEQPEEIEQRRMAEDMDRLQRPSRQIYDQHRLSNGRSAG